MSQYFALVNSENLVEQVIEGDENFVSLHPAEAGKQWVETFINDQDGKNYAGVGYTYDPGMNDFIPPKPYPSWVQNGNTWEPPTPIPPGNWKWDEATVSWVETPAVPG